MPLARGRRIIGAMLDYLHLTHFKSWRDSGRVALAPVTMLLGANSSGKSSLLQSLLLLKQTVAAPDRTTHLNLGGDEAHDFFSFGDFDRVLTQGSAAPRQFSLAFGFVRPGHERVARGDFFCSYSRSANGAVVVQELCLSSAGQRFRVQRRERGAYWLWVGDELNPRGKGAQLAPERSVALPAEALALLGADGALLQDLSLAVRRELEGIVYLGPLRRKPGRDFVWNRLRPGAMGSDGHETMAVLTASALLKGPEQGQLLAGVSRWLHRMGMAERIEVHQVGRSTHYELLVHKDGVAANLRDVGVGVAQVLPVLTMAYLVPPGSTVLLEEPELHLHPLAQAVLADMFVEVSQQRGVQFIVETHSEHLFRHLQTLVAQGATDVTRCQMHFVERQGADALACPLQMDEYGAVRNWPANFFGDAVGEARAQALARLARMRKAADHG